MARGEAPLASHILYAASGILDDGDRAQRTQGIEAGLAWAEMADAVIVYVDLGISPGMHKGIQRAFRNKIEVIERSLPEWRTDEDRKQA